MRLMRWFEEGTLYLAILAALAAGLAASYGRELEARRRPDRNWLLRRLLLMPLLAILATASAEAFDLSTSLTSFTAAMLSLGGYDALRLIEQKWSDKLRSGATAGSQAPVEQGGGDDLLPRE